MKKIVLCLLLVLGIHTNSYGLFVYRLNYNNIRLVISNNFPKDGILACSANFTTDFNCLKSPENKLVYSCTSDGTYYKRISPRNIGVFSFYNKKFKFGYDKQELIRASKHNGMGFLQWMVVYNYKIRKVEVYKAPHHFRVLAEIKNKLYFIEADKKLTFDDFTKELKKLKVKNAIYLDTGYGWETYFYKNSKNKKVYRHATNHPFPFRSNFLLIE